MPLRASAAISSSNQSPPRGRVMMAREPRLAIGMWKIRSSNVIRLPCSARVHQTVSTATQRGATTAPTAAQDRNVAADECREQVGRGRIVAISTGVPQQRVGALPVARAAGVEVRDR